MRISDSKFASTIIGVGVAGARRLSIWAAVAITLFALSWAGYALVTWARYGRVVVVGAVTQPWEADVVFRGLPPDAFAAFDEPAYVKIVWTLEVEPRGDSASVFRTQTRAATTDVYARSRFRRYWAVFSPGILLIRLESLRLVKADAERRTREAPSRDGQPLGESEPL